MWVKGSHSLHYYTFPPRVLSLANPFSLTSKTFLVATHNTIVCDLSPPSPPHH